MTNRADELDRFKRDVPLTAVAASLGYARDAKASSRASEVMRRDDGEKIVVTRNALSGHWVYFNPLDEHDSGCVVDFLQWRQGSNLGQVRVELRKWLGTQRPAAEPATYRADVQPVTVDRAALLARWAAAEPLERVDPYLTTTRGIPAALCGSDRFTGRIYSRRPGEVWFPHWNRDGLCGWEIKAQGMTRMPPGSTKGLWGSRSLDDDRRLCVAETALDALSHAAVRPNEATRYVSLAGSMNKQQPGLLASAMNKLPAGGQVVLIFDADDGGDRLAEKVTAIFEELDRDDLTLGQDRPPTPGRDWNDELRAQSSPAASSPCPNPE